MTHTTIERELTNGHAHEQASGLSLRQTRLKELVDYFSADVVREAYFEVRQLLRRQNILEPDSCVERKGGIAYFKKGTEVRVPYSTDCYEPETNGRLAEWINILDPFLTHVSEHVHPVDPLNTTHLGYCFSTRYFERKALYEDAVKNPDKAKTPELYCPAEPLIFMGNAAPRPENNPEGIGTEFVYAELGANTRYFGTLENALNRVRDEITCLYELNIEYLHPNTSFRSRFIPEMVARYLAHDETIFTKKLDLSIIPEPILGIVGSIDSFGNIKLGISISDEDYRRISNAGQAVISIAGVEHTAKVGANLGGAKKGELIITASTSRHGIGDDKHGVVIYRQCDDAAVLFANNGRAIKPGALVTIEPVN